MSVKQVRFNCGAKSVLKVIFEAEIGKIMPKRRFVLVILFEIVYNILL